MNNIVNIEIEKIHNHPKNPRREVGDVTELSNSIKDSGLMQNLTVVPREDGEYTVLIGHRRLAASHIAGLKTVPCAIREGLSEREQIAIMVAENMQRADLTVVEQAQSMQMMMDLGDTVADISQKTGLSESTVRTRLKIAKIDPAVLKKAERKQISIGDYMKVLEIEDEKTRELVLLSAGTNNFDSELQKAIRAQKSEKAKADAIKLLTECGYRMIALGEKTDGYIYEANIYDYEKKDLKKEIERFSPEKYLVRIGYSIDFYRERNAEDDRKREEAGRFAKWRDGLEEKIERITQPLFERIEETLQKYNPKKDDLKDLTDIYIVATFQEARFNFENALKMLGIKVNRNEIGKYHWHEEYIKKAYADKPEETILLLLASCFLDKAIATFGYYDKKVLRIASNTDLFLQFLDLIERYGFNLSDEERSLIDGTHPIYSERYEESTKK